MKITMKLLSLLVLTIALSTAVYGQTDRIAVPFSDPSRPGILKVSLISGSIKITGYDGKEVVIEASNRRSLSSDDARKSKGMIRLSNTSTGLTVEEERNEMSVSASSHLRAVDMNIKVPVRTSLRVGTINDGDVFIENVEGEIEANNVNGEIKVLNVSGTVLANTTNGDVTVSFNKLTPDKPMSFVSFNGDVDVTFPPNVKASVKLKSEQGEIYSDFEVKLEERTKTIKEDNREKGGKFRLSVESAMYGSINGGGPEFYFSTFNGQIFLRKKK